MNVANTFNQLKERLSVYWLARTEQERKYLSVGAAAVLLALVYSLFVEPAASGRAQLRKEVPQLRQQAAQLQALALEAGELAARPPVQVVPMTRDSLAASLATRSITPQSITMTGQFAKLDMSGVSFANLVAWLDAQRRENRISVQEASVTAQAAVGQVDATLTLRQHSGEAGTGAQ